MTLKLELNDWEALAVEVALIALQDKWIEGEKDSIALKAALQTLIDKIRAGKNEYKAGSPGAKFGLGEL